MPVINLTRRFSRAPKTIGFVSAGCKNKNILFKMRGTRRAV
jgi:hypothetical protein